MMATAGFWFVANGVVGGATTIYATSTSYAIGYTAIMATAVETLPIDPVNPLDGTPTEIGGLAVDITTPMSITTTSKTVVFSQAGTHYPATGNAAIFSVSSPFQILAQGEGDTEPNSNSDALALSAMTAIVPGTYTSIYALTGGIWSSHYLTIIAFRLISFSP